VRETDIQTWIVVLLELIIPSEIEGQRMTSSLITAKEVDRNSAHCAGIVIVKRRNQSVK